MDSSSDRSRLDRPRLTRTVDQEEELEPRNPRPEELDFSLLRAYFDPASVRVEYKTLKAYALEFPNAHPLGRLLGECWRAASGDCPYCVVGLSTIDDPWQAYAWLREKPQAKAFEQQLGRDALKAHLDACDRLYDVYSVRFRVPLLVGSLLDDPILDHVPITLDLLELTGHGGRSRSSEAWEVLRVMKDTSNVAALELPLNSPDHLGRDFAVHRDHLDKLEVRKLPGKLRDHRLVVARGLGALPTRWRDGI